MEIPKRNSKYGKRKKRIKTWKEKENEICENIEKEETN